MYIGYEFGYWRAPANYRNVILETAKTEAPHPTEAVANHTINPLEDCCSVHPPCANLFQMNRLYAECREDLNRYFADRVKATDH